MTGVDCRVCSPKPIEPAFFLTMLDKRGLTYGY